MGCAVGSGHEFAAAELSLAFKWSRLVERPENVNRIWPN